MNVRQERNRLSRWVHKKVLRHVIITATDPGELWVSAACIDCRKTWWA